jgi:hypothetical protein
LEQLNIVGKRSGDGFVAHKAMLVSALSRALADRVQLMDFTIGRRGLLGYLKALGGSNVVKVIPSNASASGEQANGHKRLKVTCGANTSYLEDLAWIKMEGKRITPLTICEVRVSQEVDEVEELMNSLAPTLWRMREKAEELRRIPNLPGYIDQPTVTMTNKIDNFNSYIKGYLERIRNLIPKEALEEERKALEYGRQQSLI